VLLRKREELFILI